MIDDNLLLPGIQEPLKNPWFTDLLGLLMHIAYIGLLDSLKNP